MDIPIYVLIDGAERGLVLAALPSNYRVGAKESNGYAILEDTAPNNLVGWAKVSGSYVSITDVDDLGGKKFRFALNAKFPLYIDDANRPVWVVLVPWHKGWTYFGNLRCVTMNTALEELKNCNQEIASGAVLCSYLPSACGPNRIVTLSTRMIIDSGTVARDEGPRTFDLTSEERFFLPPAGCLDPIE